MFGRPPGTLFELFGWHRRPRSGPFLSSSRGADEWRNTGTDPGSRVRADSGRHLRCRSGARPRIQLSGHGPWFEYTPGSLWGQVPNRAAGYPDFTSAAYDCPAEHWIHLRTNNPIESTFATVRHRTKVTKGPGSKAAGIAMASKLIESAQERWRA